MSQLDPMTDQQPSTEGGAIEESSPSVSSIRQPIGLAATILGLVLAAVGCIGGPAMAAITIAGTGAPSAPVVQQALALTVLGLGLGGALAAVGIGVWQRRPSRPFYPQRTWPLWLLLVPLLIIGSTILLLDLGSTYLIPPVNTTTMILLVVLVLGTIGRTLAGSGGTWRDVLVGLVSGASVGTLLSLAIELTLVVIAAMVATAIGLVPISLSDPSALQSELSQLLSDPGAAADLLTPPLVLAALSFVSVIVPVTEEASKILGVAIAGHRLRPTPARAFLLGAASGAGFALTENLFNGAIISLVWAPGVFMRLAATVMHCAASGLVGWGCGELWSRRRPGRLVLAFVGAVSLHGVWNGLALAVAVGGLVLAGQSPTSLWAVLGSLMVLVLGSALVGMAIATLVGLVWAGRALARREAGR